MLMPPVIIQPLLSRLLIVISPPLYVLFISGSLFHKLSIRPRSAGFWLYTVTLCWLFASTTLSGMYVSVGTAMFRTPSWLRFSRRV